MLIVPDKYSYENRMIAAQAKLISDQRADHQRLMADNARLRTEIDRLRPHARFYMTLQNAIAENENLQSEWHSFVALMCLFLDDKHPGITSSLFES